MMLIPFLTLTLGLLAAAGGLRPAALALWGFSVAFTLVLFQMHATDKLNLVF